MKNIKQSLGFCLLLALLSMATIATAQTPAQPSVGEILNTDGTLRLERDGGYSLDGYELQMDASGAPRVVPKGEAQTENTTSGTWGTLGTSSNNGLNGPVSVLAVYNNELYVGGAFTFALTPTGNISANRIARWNGTSWNTLGSGSSNGVNNDVNALAVYNGELYVGGFFTLAGGSSASRIARWNGTSWNTLGLGPSNGVNSTVNALAVYNNILFVGGEFTSAGGASVNRIARWNGTTWNTLGFGVNGFVRALAVYNGELYVGGDFTQAGGSSANHIARWNGTNWNALGTGSANGVNGRVSALAVYNNGLFVGGTFTTAGGSSANRIVRWNGITWATLGSGSSNGVSGNGSVFALSVYNNELFVGGEFTQVGNTFANRIARWDGTTWNSVGTDAANGVSGGNTPIVYALAAYNNSLFVGGGFTSAGGASANRIAEWTATSSNTQEPTINQPHGYALLQNYPNPFNPTTVISYQLPTASTVSLKVYDVLGKEVMTLVNARQSAGSYTYTLNASNLASGVYFYRLQAGSATSGASSFVQTKKMLLVK